MGEGMEVVCAQPIGGPVGESVPDEFKKGCWDDQAGKVIVQNENFYRRDSM